MTAADALELRPGDLIRVRKPHGVRTFRAAVIGEPSLVKTEHAGDFVLVSYRLRSRSYGADANTFSNRAHVAILGGRGSFELTLEEAAS